MNFSAKTLIALTFLLVACTFNESRFATDSTGGSGGDTTAGGSTSGASTGGGSTTGGATEGSGSAGTVDPIPLARYRLAQEPGPAPTEIIDDAPNPLNLPLNIVANSPRFVVDSNNNTYLRFEETTSPDTGGARLPIAGTKLAPIHGSKQITLVAKYTADACNDKHQRIFGYSNGGNPGDFGMLLIREQLNVDFFLVKWSNFPGASAYKWPTDCPFAEPLASPPVVHWVINTDEPIPSDRVRGYVDGQRMDVEVFDYRNDSNSWPDQGATIDLLGNMPNEPAFATMGTEATEPRTSNTKVWYAAVYDQALTDEDILKNAQDLLLQDDEE